MRFSLKRGLLFAALLWGLFSPLTAQSTYVHVTIFLNDGSEPAYDMQSSSYMYFEDGVTLVITENSDNMTAVSYPLADIRKITCEEMVGTLENATIDVSLYPNPVRDILHFRNVTGLHTINIYAIDGQKIKSFQITGNQSVDISDLPSGLYLVNDSYNTFKMIKL